MLILLSPSKALDYASALPAGLPHTLPHFARQAQQLIGVLRELSPQQIATLMKLSDKLAGLNAARFQAWSPQFTAENARQAVLAFDGDVYDGLDARSLGLDDLQWAQQRVAILSGLYGVLRPLDWMQPYRLEMGTALKTAQGASLYRFWGSRITEFLNQWLAQDDAPVVVNLASKEYFKSVQPGALKAPVVECVFEDCRAGQYRVISFFAKRARGLMARYVIQERIADVERLKAFSAEGYAFAETASEPGRLVFRRRAVGR